jgi:precorrin-3B C17-methyltransferase
MGKIYIVGLGPGSMEDMTFRARQTLENCKIIVGNEVYRDLLKSCLLDKEYITTDNNHEIEFCDEVLRIAFGQNEDICVISSGDSGIYGVAGRVIERAAKYPQIEVEVIPGITALVSAASIVGAPVMNDFAVISLDDITTPWKTIEKRLECASMGDFVISLYNPKMNMESTRLDQAVEIIMKYKGYTTPVAVVKNAACEHEKFIVCMLTELKYQQIDKLSVIIIGNSKTYILNGKMVTPMGHIF